MNSVSSMFEKAQLAEASYADFLNFAPVDALQNNGSEFSRTQANTFVTHWQVVDQFSDAPLFSTGFSATVFKNIDTSSPDFGRYVIAMRGTAGVGDLLTDAGDVLADGIAIYQLVDLYNYWQSLTHVGVYQAAKVVTLTAETAALQAAYSIGGIAGGLTYETLLRQRADIIVDNPSHTVLTVQLGVTSTELSDPQLQVGSGKLSGIANIDAVGHSLGGHLAMAFSRLFPNQTRTATAINGAGFDLGNSNVDHLFALLSGGMGFDASKIANVVGTAAMNLVAQDWRFLQQPAGRVEAYTESFSLATTLGHGSGQMTDSLALYSSLAQLSPSISMSQIRAYMEAASVENTKSFESTLDALRHLLLGTAVPATPIGNREQYYTNLFALQASPAYTALLGNASIVSPNISINSARNDFNQFLSLYYLTPFVISTSNASALANIQSAHATLFGQWQQDQALSPAERAAGKAHYSEQWLADRATQQQWMIRANTTDELVLQGPQTDATWRFIDQTTDSTITVNSSSLLSAFLPTRSVQFGKAEANSTLTGGDDVLAGGNGWSTLLDRLAA